MLPKYLREFLVPALQFPECWHYTVCLVILSLITCLCIIFFP